MPLNNNLDTWVCDGCGEDLPIKSLIPVDKYVLCVDCEKDSGEIVSKLREDEYLNHFNLKEENN